MAPNNTQNLTQRGKRPWCSCAPLRMQIINRALVSFNSSPITWPAGIYNESPLNQNETALRWVIRWHLAFLSKVRDYTGLYRGKPHFPQMHWNMVTASMWRSNSPIKHEPDGKFKNDDYTNSMTSQSSPLFWLSISWGNCLRPTLQSTVLHTAPIQKTGFIQPSQHYKTK